MKDDFRLNNFDLIRLLAALQVALRHMPHHLDIRYGPWTTWFIEIFPGVPVFFFISGFLISRSYENNPSLREYAQNRLLRIYPALFACTILSLLSVLFSGYLRIGGFRALEMAALFLGQVSIFQFWNPEFMRGFGSGVLNGSLWTITVELQFYVLVPCLYRILPLRRTHGREWRLLVLILVFLCINRAYYAAHARYEEAIWHKLWMVTFSPWFYMFLLGVLFQRNFTVLYRLLAGRFWILLPFYAAAIIPAAMFLGLSLGNSVSPFIYLFLAVLVFSLAYSYPGASRRSLRGNDISYGVYIYHVPVLNLFMHFGWTGNAGVFTLALGVILACSMLSWFLVEKPFLKLKHRPLNPLAGSLKVPLPGPIGESIEAR